MYCERLVRLDVESYVLFDMTSSCTVVDRTQFASHVIEVLSIGVSEVDGLSVGGFTDKPTASDTSTQSISIT
jgi:hypothetical protein